MRAMASTKGIVAVAVLLIIGGLGAALPARAADVEGSSDHPLVGRYDGSEIVGYKTTEFDEAYLIEAPFSPTSTNGGTGFKTVEGHVTLIYYTLPQGRSTLEVLRNYEEGLNAKGFSEVFTCATKNGSCFESGQPEGGYLLGQAVGDPLSLPKLSDDYVHNWFQDGGRYLLARLDRPEGAVFLKLRPSRRRNCHTALYETLTPRAATHPSDHAASDAVFQADGPKHGAAPAPFCDVRPSCQAQPSQSPDGAATTSPPSNSQYRTVGRPTGGSRHPKPPPQPAREDHRKVVEPSDAGLLSSQNLESQIRPTGNPFRFNQAMKRSSG